MTEILEKMDLLDFEKRLMSYLELISTDPLKEWFSIDDLAKLRQCSISELYKNSAILPLFGTPEDKWGRTPVWSRRTVKNWLLRTRKELEIIADARSPKEVEEAEIRKLSQSYATNDKITA